VSVQPEKQPTPAICETPSADLVSAYRRSGWVFRATVTKVNAATEQQPPDFADMEHQWNLNNMVVVRIDQVFQQPAEAPLPPGTQDTIILKAKVDMAVGAQLDFFVDSFEAASTWVFTELAREPATLAPDVMNTRVAALAQYASDADLYARLSSAQRVVRASVQSVTDLPDPITDEHPDWFEAQVLPIETLSGTAGTDAVAVRFDGAQNFFSYQRPKLTTAMTDVVLALQQDDQSGHSGFAYLVIDPLDVQDASALDRVKRLLASPPAVACVP
jgi:hypothetical protein